MHFVIVSLIRLRRPIVPVRITRTVVQVHVERPTLQPVVGVAVHMGKRRTFKPYVIILFIIHN